MRGKYLPGAEHQLLLQAPGQRGEVAGVLVGVDALAEDADHEEGVHQHQEAGGRGVDLGQQTGVAQVEARGHTDTILDALNTRCYNTLCLVILLIQCTIVTQEDTTRKGLF